jgi:hypothetical protein
MSYSIALGQTAGERELFDGAFLFCTACKAVHRVTQSDRASIYLPDGTPIAANDQRQFLAAHRDHGLQLLERSSDAEVISHPRWDPMCRVAWEVSDGQNELIVTFGRIDIEAPRQYSILPGRIVVERESVEVDGEALHQVIDEALYPHAAPLGKIQALVDECRRLVSTAPFDSIEPLEESRDDPNVQLACLPDSIARALRVEVMRMFSSAEAAPLVDVIDGDLRRDIPVLRLTRNYRIETQSTETRLR